VREEVLAGLRKPAQQPCAGDRGAATTRPHPKVTYGTRDRLLLRRLGVLSPGGQDRSGGCGCQLSDLAELLQSPAIVQQTEQWSYRYALSDSVFLTYPYPVQALRQAGDLVFNLVNLNVAKADPVLIRGALAHGEVRHLKGIFLTSAKPANLVGDAVVEAVILEHTAGFKGLRILPSERLAHTIATADPALVAWQLRPAAAPEV